MIHSNLHYTIVILNIHKDDVTFRLHSLKNAENEEILPWIMQILKKNIRLCLPNARKRDTIESKRLKKLVLKPIGDLPVAVFREYFAAGKCSRP